MRSSCIKEKDPQCLHPHTPRRVHSQSNPFTTALWGNPAKPPSITLPGLEGTKSSITIYQLPTPLRKLSLGLGSSLIEVTDVDEMVLVGRDTFQASGKGNNCPRACLIFAGRVTVQHSRMFLTTLWHLWMSAESVVENL